MLTCRHLALNLAFKKSADKKRAGSPFLLRKATDELCSRQAVAGCNGYFSY
jgi:hypothetical protein